MKCICGFEAEINGKKGVKSDKFNEIWVDGNSKFVFTNSEFFGFSKMRSPLYACPKCGIIRTVEVKEDKE